MAPPSPLPHGGSLVKLTNRWAWVGSVWLLCWIPWCSTAGRRAATKAPGTGHVARNYYIASVATTAGGRANVSWMLDAIVRFSNRGAPAAGCAIPRRTPTGWVLRWSAILILMVMLAQESMAWGASIVPLADGRVLVGGHFVANGTSNLARLNADLTVDRSFHPATWVSSSTTTIQDMVCQQDGGMVLLGAFGYVTGNSTLLRRLNPDGSADAGFASLEGSQDAYLSGAASASTFVVQNQF